MSQYSDFSFFKKKEKTCFEHIINNFSVMNREKASPQTTQPPAHVIKCETAACCVYADDDVTANGTAAKAGVSWPSARSRRTTWGWGEGERSAHDLSVQTMQGENWRERRGTEREVAGDTYQSDDGGSGPGARHDVQVVGQVELEKRTAALVDCHVELQSQGCSDSSNWKSDFSDVCFSVN